MFHNTIKFLRDCGYPIKKEKTQPGKILDKPFGLLDKHYTYPVLRGVETSRINRPEIENINGDEICGNMKTRQGRAVWVPIRHKIMDSVHLLKEVANLCDSKYLVCDPNGSKLTYLNV